MLILLMLARFAILVGSQFDAQLFNLATPVRSILHLNTDNPHALMLTGLFGVAGHRALLIIHRRAREYRQEYVGLFLMGLVMFSCYFACTLLQVCSLVLQSASSRG